MYCATLAINIKDTHLDLKNSSKLLIFELQSSSQDS